MAKTENSNESVTNFHLISETRQQRSKKLLWQ